MKTIAILGSWDPRWIADHRAWLCDGVHYDGWKNRISQENAELLREQKTFNFYAYLPRSKRGCGHVVFRLTCRAAEYSRNQGKCGHKHRKHHDTGSKRYRLCFVILHIDELKSHLSVRAFESVTGTKLKNGQSTLAMPLVVDRHWQVKS